MAHAISLLSYYFRLSPTLFRNLATVFRCITTTFK